MMYQEDLLSAYEVSWFSREQAMRRLVEAAAFASFQPYFRDDDDGVLPVNSRVPSSLSTFSDDVDIVHRRQLLVSRGLLEASLPVDALPFQLTTTQAAAAVGMTGTHKSRGAQVPAKSPSAASMVSTPTRSVAANTTSQRVSSARQRPSHAAQQQPVTAQSRARPRTGEPKRMAVSKPVVVPRMGVIGGKLVPAAAIAVVHVVDDGSAAAAESPDAPAVPGDDLDAASAAVGSQLEAIAVPIATGSGDGNGDGNGNGKGNGDGDGDGDGNGPEPEGAASVDAGQLHAALAMEQGASSGDVQTVDTSL